MTSSWENNCPNLVQLQYTGALTVQSHDGWGVGAQPRIWSKPQNTQSLLQSYYNWSLHGICLFRIYSAVYGSTGTLMPWPSYYEMIINLYVWESGWEPHWQGSSMHNPKRFYILWILKSFATIIHGDINCLNINYLLIPCTINPGFLVKMITP